MKKENRYEIKFALNELEITQALSWLSKIGARKKYEDRNVNSLYFDNLNHEAIKDNLAGITPRHKVRLRWYGDITSEVLDPNLEIKIRNGRLGSKILFPLAKIKNLISTESIYSLSKNIFWELRRSKFTHKVSNNYLLPMLIAQYQRKYYEIDNGIRITIDREIRFLNANQNVRLKFLRPINYNYYVMELKFSQDLKFSAAKLIQSLSLTPKRFSKYLIGSAMLGYTSYI